MNSFAKWIISTLATTAIVSGIVYAAAISSVTTQTINSGDAMGVGWFQAVNDHVKNNTLWQLNQNNCTWINVTTCGHQCWQGNQFQMQCPAGKYMAWWGTDTWNEYSAYNFRIYCCNP